VRSIYQYKDHGVTKGKGRFVGLAPRTEDDKAIEATALEGFTFDGQDIFLKGDGTS